MKNFKSKDLMITIPSMEDPNEKPGNLTLPHTAAAYCQGSCAFLSFQAAYCQGSCAFLSFQAAYCQGSCAFLSFPAVYCQGSCAFLSFEQNPVDIASVQDSRTLAALKEKLNETLREIEKQQAGLEKKA